MTTVVDLHPEELLDRDVRGELSQADRARLDAHLVRCGACRLERQLRGDFAEELASDVTPSSVERLTLAGSLLPRPSIPVTVTPTAAEKPPLASRRMPRRVSRATWLLAAAAVFGVSVAGATGAGQRAWSRLVGPPPSAPATDAVPVRAASRHVARHRAAPASVPAIESTHEEPTTIDLLAPPAPPPRPSAPPPRRAAPVDHAAALFDSATDARRRGDYAQALALHHDLEARYPRSREAHVSRATVGRLLLDRGDPAGALASFDSYLAGGSGELGEEVMVGRATALERLGRALQAAAAWQALLAAYPTTPYAAHARSRLGSMSVR